jgi:hypothetical protein
MTQTNQQPAASREQYEALLTDRTKPTREDLFALNEITDPIERGWAAKQIALRAENTDATGIAERATAAMYKAIDKVIDWDVDRQLAALEQQDDLVKLGWLAESIRHRAKTVAQVHRAERDRAALILIAPFQRAVAATNEERRQLMAAKKAGQISPADYYAELEEITQRRRDALAAANVEIYPRHVYMPMGVSRGRFIQMLEELSEVQLPRMQNPMGVLEKESPIVTHLSEVQERIRPIRTDAVKRLLKQFTNLEVHRLTGLSDERAAQIRNTRPATRRTRKVAAAR